MSRYSENALVEQPAIVLFRELGWDTVNCFHETLGVAGTLGRETTAEVVLTRYLRAALEKLNPDADSEAISLAIEEIVKDRSSLNPVQANREVYKLLKEGVRVTYKNGEGEETDEVVRVINWKEPVNNHFLLASQLWISGEIYKRRADLVGFVNGIPLVFIELKATHRRLEDAYNRNLRDYKGTIPQVFWYNGFIILSNGSQSRIGSMSAAWEHFAEWKKINSEGEEGIVSLETIIRGTCARDKLLDIVENFTLFSDAGGSLVKLIAKNHQYLGVNNAIEAVKKIQENKGRLGVFWHTQGSGKSYSMIFFCQKVLRRLPGNWTFVIVTDRAELDDQIYKNFASAGAVIEKKVQAESCRHLKELLAEDHRMVFTLIQKFQSEGEGKYPKITDRDDIIVLVDEAHRSQYDTLAANMRSAMPSASFIAFTGTPLMAGEEKTREVFGDYVSIYNFRQSVEDRATVPLYYENRIPELQLINENLNDDIQDIIDSADLSEEAEKKLEREFARQYHLITRDDRLETIAGDIVKHFMNRGEMGKAMVVSIDRFTAVKMYDKVRKHWQKYMNELQKQLAKCELEEAAEIRKKLDYMKETDMAVVVSSGQNEAEAFRQKGLNILPHRRRMATEDLDTRFKDSRDPLRIVFVCAMWLTGFDAPAVNTIYLDKPMKNHTLMQTIARANRVFKDKTCGTIVDYIGVFRDLQKALAIYATPAAGGKVDTPVKDKAALLEELKKAIAETTAFCTDKGIDVGRLLRARDLELVRLLDDAVECLVVNDETKQKFLFLAGDVGKLYRAILPDPAAFAFAEHKNLFACIADKIRALAPPADISGVMAGIEEVLDRSIAAEGYIIHEDPAGYSTRVDLSQIDFEALRRHFDKSRKHTEVEKLKGMIGAKLNLLVRLNRSRIDFAERFQKMIDEYNSGAYNIDILYQKLLAFAQELNEEEKRGIAEQLTEEELAMFDILTKPEPELTGKEKAQVKKVVRELLATLKREKLVLDWRKRQQTRAAVLITIQDYLDRGLPRVYTPEIFERKCNQVYQHIYDSYFGAGRSIYSKAS
ncbi:type I restriction endonuclease subunit R [Moorella sulfitireducens]|uniref:type I restriction endonuclease subunit R n=1 Tax=Neomoorella sulfitireducens TaxID=2972948 RepID=UPI0021AC1A14|nr:type I restriction endonuclease subunit R [Moorella sulfitireducens]